MICSQTMIFQFLFIFSYCVEIIHATNLTDHQALLAFKQSILRHSAENTLSSWNDSSHFCQWEGVACGHRHQRVTSLSLETKGLAGPLSPYLGNLSFLRLLDLYNNSFAGAIPTQLGHLFRLQKLDLNHNKFKGEIPANISGCQSLDYIDVGQNNLSGKLPKELSALPVLAFLIVHRNRFTGGIPHFIGNMTSLEVISAMDIPFGGSIPDSLGQLKNLNYLALGGTNLSGIIPLSFYNLSSIVTISLDENRLQGTLLPSIGLMFPTLETLQVPINQLTGTIPLSLSNCSDLKTLEFGVNNFYGKIALDFGGLKKMEKVRMSNNLLGSGEADEMSFIHSLTNCSNLQTLELRGNRLKGPIPISIGNLSSNLSFLNLQFNQLHGELPRTIGNLVGLQNLIVDDNHFTGTIPSTIGNLTRLGRLWLQNNSFSGIIPFSIGKLSMLLELHLELNQLEGVIPTSLGNCQRLLELDLSQNNLSGLIPNVLFTISALSSYLNLSGNHFHGTMPSNVGNLRNLGSLDLSKNDLSGKIPNSLGTCTSLTSLQLQENNFQGSIPSSLNYLKGVTYLDLSKNNLSGAIPAFLQKFSIEFLNLSFNKFDGEVPIKGIFSNPSRISLVGNAGLCGGVPELQLHKCSSKKSKRMSRVLIIGIVTTGTFLCVTAMLITLFCLRKKSIKEKSPETLLKEPFLRVSYEMLLKATDGFSSENLVGKGSSGYVYKGVLDVSETVVAVKVLNLQSREASKSFMNECEALRSVRHRNLVKIVASCSSIDFQGNDFKAIVYDFMPNGSLESWLHSRPGAENEQNEHSRRLSLLQRINIAIDVACALDYLHHRCENPVIHCDLKPSNILLDEDMVAHVGDFGLAKLFNPEQKDGNQSSSLGLRGTTGYAAPEYGLGSELSTHGDVYSFGIFLLEMLTRKRPTDNMFVGGRNLHNYASMALPGQVRDIVDPFVLDNNEVRQAAQEIDRRSANTKVTECVTSIIRIGVACSVEAPHTRMNITNAYNELNLAKNTILRK